MKLFSLVALKRSHSRWLLRSYGLQPYVLDLANGCQIHCWAPASSSLSPQPHDSSAPSKIGSQNSTDKKETSSACSPSPLSEDSVENLDAKLSGGPSSSKPALLLLHAFGSDGSISWDNQLADFSKHFSLYLPDLLFFGSSSPKNHTQNTRSAGSGRQEAVRYSEIFQAECMHEAMRKLQVREAVVLGHSYGGYVAHQMAHMYPGFVKKLVVLSSGIMMNPHTNDQLLSDFGSTQIHDVLVPPTIPLFIKSLRLVFNDFLPTWLPLFLYRDMHESLGGNREDKLRLVDDIILGKEGAPPLPTIEQSTLIIWGEEDHIFDISLAHQLKEFLGDKATLSTIQGVGHMPHMLKPKEFNLLLLSYLLAAQ